jgi:hypothetical protein
VNLTKLALIETKFTMKIKKNLKTNPPATASSPPVEAVAVTTRGAASGHHKVLRAGCDYQGDGPAATTRGDGQRCGRACLASIGGGLPNHQGELFFFLHLLMLIWSKKNSD